VPLPFRSSSDHHPVLLHQIQHRQRAGPFLHVRAGIDRQRQNPTISELEGATVQALLQRCSPLVPALTYTDAGLVNGTVDGVAIADSLAGALTRAPGRNVGSYAINQGTLL
jgi:hypothetical protein